MRLTEFQPEPQTPEQVDEGLRDAMKQAKEDGIFDWSGVSLNIPKQSNWKCYLFGNRPGGTGMIYIPAEGQVPNRFVRFMMRICFDSVWVKGT